MIIVTCALIIHKNRILITQHGANSDHPFLWEFPGGKLKLNESLEACIVREIMEELEIKIEIIQKMSSVKFDYKFKEIELIPFLCSTKSVNIILNDHIQYKWINWEDLDKYELLKADRKLIQQNKNWQILKEYFRK